MSEELLPCAHCGHAVEWKYDKYADINQGNTDPFGKIYCIGCGMQTGDLQTYEEAKLVWNTREPIGDPDELPEWVKTEINGKICQLDVSGIRHYGSRKTITENKIKILYWVLSLKKEDRL